jgi:alanyl-tRNA synthetase/REP element-mobilizing transposase RayT
MTSAQIRQSFLDFLKSKGHTIVPSMSLMPASPGLLFTNSGMNQFVPIFLNERVADVDKWPGAIPGKATRAADTQKCIRAGGKHNDLDDVGLDTYHHTFFEMLGNWSFGDYFKKEAIEWAWELVVTIWKFPPQRVYATVYSPDKTKNDPSEFDQEAWDFWAEKFRSVGLDPKIHIVNGNKKDNFWMMGETGPCGPCSELHIDLTPEGNTQGALVNTGDPRCIEIWNLVFIQFNANPDGTFSPLPAQHVDTGMGLERVTSIIQGTKNFSDFANAKISNYETDIFRPIFDALEKLSGKKYGSTLPHTPQSQIAVEMGSATVPVASVGVPPTESSQGAAYSKRRLPHFERPWAKYMVSFTARERKQLSSKSRDIVLKSLLFGNEQRRYQLFAACVMPDHVHFLMEPQIKAEDKDGKPVFWPLSEILHSIKSFTAHEINKAENENGQIWENESFDRLIRGDADLEEKFHYICRNPWDAGVVPQTENYPWLWTPDYSSVAVSRSQAAFSSQTKATGAAARDAQQSDRDGRAPQTQIQIDIAFRVVADHIRTLSFAIADGIQPGNNDRNYVLRRILRRAVRYGRTLGFHEPFFYKLVDVLAETMGDVFPEIRAKKKQVQDVIRVEEEAFNKTLDDGCKIFESALNEIGSIKKYLQTFPTELEKGVQQLNELLKSEAQQGDAEGIQDFFYRLIQSPDIEQEASESLAELAKNFSGKTSLPKFATALIIVDWFKDWRKQRKPISDLLKNLKKSVDDPTEFAGCIEQIRSAISQLEAELPTIESLLNIFPGRIAFKLYDTYGFPLDLTELMARERGLTVDKEGFEKLMEEQRTRARAAQKKEIVAASNIDTSRPTKFVGFDQLSVAEAGVLDVVKVKDKVAVTVDASPLYAEMGGQVGDTGEILAGGKLWHIVNTQKAGNTFLHFLADEEAPETGAKVELRVNAARRAGIQRHHTVTHLLHWALHEVVNPEATQKGSYVGPEKLTFDFNGAALTAAQIADVEKLVNERIVENAGVSWTEVPYASVKGRKDVMQFFGEKYGDLVRVVQIGGHGGALDGYSMELCGGTHARATGEIGLFRILSESAVAAGIRRIEAVAGLRAYEKSHGEAALISTLAAKVNAPVLELEKKIDALLAQQKELEKQLKAAQQKQAAETARTLIGKAQGAAVPAIVEDLGAVDGDFLQAVVDAVKGQFKGAVVLGGSANGAVALVASVSADFTSKLQAGKIIQAIAPLVGGKGGGKPDNARGGGKDAAKLAEALDKARELIGGAPS